MGTQKASAITFASIVLVILSLKTTMNALILCFPDAYVPSAKSQECMKGREGLV